ncbi:unnamed protein product [Owenia fusiformis]|uniref:Uncharacterized protein n=1 Tax=Owenia fusiformis TaxID=6347 RepID=A0A8J1UIN9_OWEFU|nr:unnamed protein product [Owenia fusiformis]
MATVVIDSGSLYTKAGFAGESDPEVTIPLNAGDIPSPVEDGVITNWENMEKLWRELFRDALKVDPTNQNVLLTDPMHNTDANREKLARMMFENFKVPALYIARQPILVLYSNGITSGMVVDFGLDGTSIVPVIDSKLLPETSFRLPLGGSHITKYLAKLLNTRGYSFETPAELAICEDIKQKLCYVALDVEEQMKKKVELLESTYMLPDGKSITIGNELFRAPEALFKPSSIGINCDGIPQAIFASIMKWDTSYQKNLFSNIILTGGTALGNAGIADRIKKEISALAPAGTNVRVKVSAYLKNDKWNGGSLLAAHPDIQHKWITKQQFEKTGLSTLHN